MPAIIFDFDGVVADSEPLHHRTLAALAAERFDFELTTRDYMLRYVAYDDRDAIRQLHRDTGRPEPDADALAELCKAKQAAFDRLVETGEVTALPGAIELIDACVERDVPRAIASGATRQDIVQILEGFKRKDAFEIIVSADDVERSKPDPTTYRLACEKVGVAPGDAIAIEDTAAGLASAREAGLTTLGVATTHDADYLTAHAHHVVASLADITLDEVLGLIGSRSK